MKLGPAKSARVSSPAHAGNSAVCFTAGVPLRQGAGLANNEEAIVRRDSICALGKQCFASSAGGSQERSDFSRRLAIDCDLEPVEFLFDLMESVVADLVVFAHRKHSLPRRLNGSPVDFVTVQLSGVA